MPTKHGHQPADPRPGGRAAETPPEAYEQKIEQLESELAEARNQQLRLAADFDNYKKRSRQEAADSVRYASMGVVEKVLPVLDDCQRALDHAPAGVDENWLRGLALTVSKLEEVLVSQGLAPIESVGTRFDPSVHEAIGSEESAEHPEDTVLTELRRGWKLHDRVVRPALVRVSRRPSLPSSA